jgi:hypothetical protein
MEINYVRRIKCLPWSLCLILGSGMSLSKITNVLYPFGAYSLVEETDVNQLIIIKMQIQLENITCYKKEKYRML